MRFKILNLILSSFIAYAFIFNAPFKTIDDHAAIINNPLIKDIANIGRIFTTSYFNLEIYWRPMVFLSHMAEYHLFGLNPFFYYLTNVLLNLGSAIIVFFLLRLLLKNEQLAFFAALLFIIHPIHTTAVTNISGRPILLSAFFYLAAFYGYCCYKEKGGMKTYLGSLFFFIAALLTKESAVMLPVLIVFYDWIFRDHKTTNVWRLPYTSLPFWAILAGYFIARHSLGIVRMFQERSLYDAALQCFTFASGVLTYLRLMIFPEGLHFDRSMALIEGLGDPIVYWTLSAYALMAIIFIRNRSRVSKTTLFLIGWFWIELIPVSQLFVPILIQPGYIALSEHFLYVASISLFALMVTSVYWLYQKNQEHRWVSQISFKGVICGVLLLFLTVTVTQSIYAGSEEAMLKQTLRHNPQNIRMRESYGWALVKLGRFKEAEGHYRKLLKISPQHVRARISLGKVLCDQGMCAQGLKEYERVEDAGRLSKLLEANIIATLNVLIAQHTQQDEPQQAQYYQQKLDAYRMK